MLTKAWKKIDKFYAVLALVVLILAVPLVFTAREVFSAIILSYGVDTGSDKAVRINRDQLDTALKIYNDETIPALEVKASVVVGSLSEVEDEGI